MVEQYLELPSFPYRFDLLLEVVRRNAYPARMVVESDSLWRFVGGKLLCFRQDGDVIVLTGPALCKSDDSRRHDVSGLSRQILGMDCDLSDFYAAARRDARLWRQIEPLFGLPLFGTETVFEALVTLIIEQHISWKNALRSQRRLMRMLDSGVRTGGYKVHDFPTPQELTALEAEQLKPLKITNGRINLILRVAREARDGVLDLEGLRHLEASEAYSRLMSIKGVGHWTAANVLGRAFGKYPYVSHNDVALQSAVNHYFYRGAGEKSAKQVLETLEEYGEYAGLVGHFILLRWVLDKYPVAH
ncbi:MAG: hypothetical protein OXG39_00440 [Chloroflexi bacterium]|nr:hypothetical protein [Chloroflexota bacterium]